MMSKRNTGLWILVVIMQLLFISSSALAVDAVDVIRNGSFEAGLSDWNINQQLPSSWNPLVLEPLTDVPDNHAVQLHPPNYSFQGNIIYQNLNVTGIGGKTFSFSCNLTAVYPQPTGNSIALYVDYLDNGSVVSDLVYNPANSLITSATPLNTNFIFPATATRLLKFRVVKVGYGDFTIDNITFKTPTGITVGAVPVISSLSTTSGGYGSQFSINGSGFGATAGSVTLAGSTDGLVINSWSDTTVTMAVNDPAQSGAVILSTVDSVESNAGLNFTVTSPHYQVALINSTVSVVKGQTAEFVIKADFLNNYTPDAAGITFSASGLPVGTVYSFAPVPLLRAGGVVLRIETGTLAAGPHDVIIQASATGLASRYVTGTLEVATTALIEFDQNLTYPLTLLSSPMAVTSQGNLYIYIDAYDSNGMQIQDMQLQSSNPAVVGVYKSSYGYDVYAHSSGSAVLTATAPDGTTETLTVNVTLPATPNVAIMLSPMTITNKDSSLISLGITYYTEPGQSISAGYNGFITFVAGSSTLDFNTNSTPYFYGGQFSVDHATTGLGSYLFRGGITGGSASAENAVPLTIVNDPTYAGLNLTIKPLDSNIMPHVYEWFDIEFYDPVSGVKLFTRSNTTFTMGDNFFLGAIPPGSYKLRFTPGMGNDMVAPNWYPNAANLAEAEAVSFTAGTFNQMPYYFFAIPAPDTTPPVINTFSINGGTTFTTSSLTISGISLYAYDYNPVTGYCLTETNDSASCSNWQSQPPTEFTFGAPGVKMLYAFARDEAGNIGSAPAPLEISITTTLTLQITGSGTGTVNGDISCSQSSCVLTGLLVGSGVTLTAAPGVNSLAAWTGCTGISADGMTCGVTIAGPTTVTVAFDPKLQARISRTGILYPSVMDAYGAVQNLDMIEVRSTPTPLTGNLLFNNAAAPAVTLQGAVKLYPDDAAQDFSIIAGSLKVGKGKITVSKVKVRPLI